ncbi:MAG: hypothetical protein P0S95_05845 [Rhabdochlamydiaceae bacterium]|nr:hypothetical protein [Candidatus Amphrikana amoebophyrae]
MATVAPVIKNTDISEYQEYVLIAKDDQPHYKLLTELKTDEVFKRYGLSGDEYSDRRARLIAFGAEETTIKTEYAEKHYVPTLSGMQILTQKYEKKYGLKIYLSTQEDVVKILVAKSKEKLTKPFGIIIYRNGGKGHMTPIFCHQSKKNGKLYVMEMDSTRPIEGSNLRLYLDFIDRKKDECKDIIYVSSNAPRQASGFGCHIDALATLKYAFKTCEYEAVTHIPDFVTITEKVWSTPEKNNSILIMDIPFCWIPAMQVSQKGEERHMKVVINDKGETMSDLVNRHRVAITFQKRLLDVNDNSSNKEALTRTEVRSIRGYINKKEREYAKIIKEFADSLTKL